MRRIFDEPHYRRLVESRGDFIRLIASTLKHRLDLNRALDVGCGLGDFSGILVQLGFNVTAIDGRSDNVEEASRRFRGVRFLQGDAEDSALQRMGTFDLVLCFGLVYHLENPFRAIRNLFALTGSALMLESMCMPDQDAVLYLQIGRASCRERV